MGEDDGLVSVWELDGEGCAVGPVVPVIVGGEVVATLCAFWSDQDGVRVCVDDDAALDDLSGVQALALAAALGELASLQPPR